MKNKKVALLSLLALATAITVGCGGSGNTFTKLPIASNRVVSPTTTLFLMKLDGTSLTPVSNAPANYWSPSVSADSKKVAFVVGENVSVMNGDGTGLTQLTTYTEDQSDNFSYVYYARISPNGKSILYSVWDGTDEKDSIWSMDVDGSNKKELTATPPTGMNGCYRASFSANNHKITFACYNNSTGYAIYVADADGTNVSNVVPATAGVFVDIPMFSPDAKKVLFIGYNFTVGGSVRAHAAGSALPKRNGVQRHLAPRVPDNQGVFSFNVDGSAGTLVVPGVSEAIILNSSMYYSLYDTDISHNQIWKADVDGTSAVKLSDGTADDWLDLGGF